MKSGCENWMFLNYAMDYALFWFTVALQMWGKSVIYFRIDFQFLKTSIETNGFCVSHSSKSISVENNRNLR